MLLTTDELVKLLRDSVNIQTGDEEVVDPLYLSMSDEDLLLYIKLACTHAFPSVTDLSDLEDGSEFALVLLAKIDLYMKLAVMRAEKVDLGADNNNYIKNSQRFDHYMKLADGAKQEYQDYLDEMEDGGLDPENSGVRAFDVILSKWHYTNRNYEHQDTPKVKIKVYNVTADSVEFGWSVSKVDHFGKYKVYLSKSQIVDIFKDGAYADEKINEGAKLIKSTTNIRDNYHKITGLEENSTYFIAVFSIERNQVFGYKEVTFNTLKIDTDDEEVNIENAGDLGE